MALLPLSPRQQDANKGYLLAKAKRDPEMQGLLDLLPTRIDGAEAWAAKRRASSLALKELLGRETGTEEDRP